MIAITKTIDAMRGIERWGSSSLLDKAFAGFEALPAPTRQTWCSVLGVSESAPWHVIENAFRIERAKAHPDRGGAPGEFQRVMDAFEQAKRARGAA